MIDDFLNNVSIQDNARVKDTNKEMGERVKRYTLVNKYFDNYLRFNKKQIIADFVKYLLLGSLLITYLLNKLLLDLSIKENLSLIANEYAKLFSYVIVKTFNKIADKFNILFMDILEITNNKIEVKNIEYNPTLELDQVFMGMSIVLVIYFTLIIYQYLIQRDLFNATFTNYYVPLWGLYHYNKRNKHNYFYIRLVRHQKQVNIISTYSKNILKNLFDLEDLELDKKDKIDIELTPRKFLWFYDYYLMTYSINNQKQNIPQTEDTKRENLEKTDNHKTTNLEVLDLETLDKLGI